MAEDQATGTAPKSSKKTALIGVALLALLAAAGGGVYVMTSNNKELITSADYRVLDTRDNAQRVSVSGQVEAFKTVALTTRLPGPVQTIDVRVGDRVQAEQVVANIDVSALERELANKRAQQTANDATALSQIENAERAYNQNKAMVDEGLNPEINGAVAALRQAEANYEKLNAEFEFARTQHARGNDPTIIAQHAAVQAAREQMLLAAVDAARTGANAAFTSQQQQRDVQALHDANTALSALEQQRAAASDEEEIRRLDSEIAAMKAQVSQLETVVAKYPQAYTEAGLGAVGNAAGLSAAQRTLQDSQRTLDHTLGATDQKLAATQKDVALAFEAKKDAATSLETARRSVDNQLKNQQAAVDDAVRSARAARVAAGAGDSQLQVDIASSQVRTPTEGVVTRVDAKEGAPAAGALLTVADDRRLIVRSTVKELDVSKVEVGQKVEFTTAGTGDKKFTGKVSFVSPAAAPPELLNPALAAGANQSSATTPKATFPIEIEVEGDREGLRLGATAKARIITKPASTNMLVAKGAVFEGKNKNEKFVLVVAEHEGKTKIVKRKITVGHESEFDFEVTGGDAKKGDKVLTDYKRFLGKIDEEVEVESTPATPGEKSDAPESKEATK
ncbi:MAG: HlyD family efflux transporter periplasmic adaptor subunit [Corynebacterium sp.]|uniref:HlyD family efflux transporter periplasmic adaptor subunit n=1 Tax=Corynebacterium sp. TaxID=1720 RepID=UPI0026DCD386|nr:HlyD family efflux transporter periplasmic adaptor subunit [Corynebacterium sp.]MDO4760787.1 HlyD family efflux transporter periplasmic adaptor subunit [Corynebacterium sp.]